MSDSSASNDGIVSSVSHTESGDTEKDTGPIMSRSEENCSTNLPTIGCHVDDCVTSDTDKSCEAYVEIKKSRIDENAGMGDVTNYNANLSLSAFKEATLKLLDQVTADDSTRQAPASGENNDGIDVEMNKRTHDCHEPDEADKALSLSEIDTGRSGLNSTVDQTMVHIPVLNEAGTVPECSDQTSNQDVVSLQLTDKIVSSFSDSAHIENIESSIDLTKSESPKIVNVHSESESNISKPQSSMDISSNTTVDQTLESSGQCKFTAIPYVPMNASTVADKLDDEPSAKKLKLVPESPTNAVLVDLGSSHDVVIVTETPNTCIDEVTQRQSVFQFKESPRQLTGAWKNFEDSSQKNYLRGCKWAPDGTCLLTNSNDNSLKIFNLPDELYYDGGENKIIPEMSTVIEIKEADTVYDFSWYPLMSSSQPETSCLAVTSKDTPVHLYDAFTGELRCSYRAYNHVDEVVAAHCVGFNPDGSKLYCGFNKIIRVFDVTRPGRDFINRPTFAKEGQRGIISCIDHSPAEHGLYAAGSYARSIALYSEPDGSMVCLFEGQHGGVTQVKFSPDGTKLYSGGRKDNEILCWDMRNPGQILFTLQRNVVTNQRISFDISSDSRYVISGSTDGIVRVWDTTATPILPNIHLDPVIEPTLTFQAHKESVNSVSLHPTLPVIATGSGERHFKSFSDNDDDSGVKMDDSSDIDNSLRLWWI